MHESVNHKSIFPLGRLKLILCLAPYSPNEDARSVFFLAIKSVQRVVSGQCNKDQQVIRGRFDLLLLKDTMKAYFCHRHNLF